MAPRYVHRSSRPLRVRAAGRPRQRCASAAVRSSSGSVRRALAPEPERRSQRAVEHAWGCGAAAAGVAGAAGPAGLAGAAGLAGLAGAEAPGCAGADAAGGVLGAGATPNGVTVRKRALTLPAVQDTVPPVAGPRHEKLPSSAEMGAVVVVPPASIVTLSASGAAPVSAVPPTKPFAPALAVRFATRNENDPGACELCGTNSIRSSPRSGTVVAKLWPSTGTASACATSVVPRRTRTSSESIWDESPEPVTRPVAVLATMSGERDGSGTPAATPETRVTRLAPASRNQRFPSGSTSGESVRLLRAVGRNANFARIAPAASTVAEAIWSPYSSEKNAVPSESMAMSAGARRRPNSLTGPGVSTKPFVVPDFALAGSR